MMRQTGGSALGLISTRSTPASMANFKAASTDDRPSDSPSKPTNLISLQRISPLMRVLGAARPVFFTVFMVYSSKSFKLRELTSSFTLAMKSSSFIFPKSTPLRVRIVISLLSISFAPHTTIYGTCIKVCSRIL